MQCVCVCVINRYREACLWHDNHHTSRNLEEIRKGRWAGGRSRKESKKARNEKKTIKTKKGMQSSQTKRNEEGIERLAPIPNDAIFFPLLRSLCFPCAVSAKMMACWLALLRLLR